MNRAIVANILLTFLCLFVVTEVTAQTNTVQAAVMVSSPDASVKFNNPGEGCNALLAYWVGENPPYCSATIVGGCPAWSDLNTSSNVRRVDYFAVNSSTNSCVYSGNYRVYWSALCPAYSVFNGNGYCVCQSGTRFFEDVAKCVPVVKLPGLPGDPGNNGDQCESEPQRKQPSCGNPINPATGNKVQRETDYVSQSAGGLRLSRTYNSSPYNIDAAVVRSFGARWTQSFDAVLKQEAPQPSGMQGTCWRREDTKYIWCETPPVPELSAIPDAVSIVRGDGKKYLFNRSGNVWIAKGDVNDRITAIFNGDNTAVVGWTYVSANGDSIERFDADGRLISIAERSGIVKKFTYSNGVVNDSSAGRLPADAPICSRAHPGAVLSMGRLLCVTDHGGYQLQFEYDAQGRIVKLIDPDNQETTYAYDGVSAGCSTFSATNRACAAGNLTQVTYPNGKGRTYYYNEAAQINNGVACTNAIVVGDGFGHLHNSLTGIVDENDNRYASWTYDCQGRATSSEHAGGIEKVVIAYGSISSTGTTATTVTHHVGDSANPQATTRSYNYQQVLGITKNTGITQPCVECGSVASRSYDANGNVSSATDWNNNKTCYGYNLTRNLETARVKGLTASADCAASLTAAMLTAPAHKITTQWHPTYRLPASIAEPKRVTMNTYDAQGNLLKKTVQATSDADGTQGLAATVQGTARIWSYTYNEFGQVLTATDPGGGVTRHSYDTQGNLTEVTNALGHVTTLSNYDANGRVGRIVDPNGLTTNLSYSPRGWLTSRTVGEETTTYDYDNAGQLKKVTLPDGSSIHYTYDDAHRLTDIADSLGNRVVYTLDAMGNRIKEEVKDPGGALARQTTRVYDALNRLQQVTGAQP